MRFLIIFLLSFSVTTQAQEQGKKAKAAPVVKSEQKSELDQPAETQPPPRPTAGKQFSPNIEEWYTLWGLGFSGVKYPSDVQNSLDSLNGLRHTTFNFDVLGFYWPWSNQHTMHGVIFNFVSDGYHDSTGSLTISQNLFAYSIHHFFGENIGDGWYVRGDVGIAVYNITISDSSTTLTAQSENGFGILFGGGYAWPISSETRFLLGANVATRNVKESKISTLNLTAGWLF